MALPAAGLYTRYRHLIPELLKFCVVGGFGAVIDLGGAAVLHGKYHVGPLESKAISTIIATVLTYLGSRFWTFKHRENQALGREATLFIVLNVIGLVIAEAVIALVTYGFGRHSQLEYNAASVVGTGLATIFRYFAYRQWVFTAPAEPSVGIASSPDLAPVPDYPPWEGDPAFLAAEVMAPAAATAGWNSSEPAGWNSPEPAGWNSPEPAGWNSSEPAGWNFSESAGWNSSDAVPAASWRPDPAPSWQPASERPSWDAAAEPRFWETSSEVRSSGPSDEPTQPWLESSVISNDPVTSPLPPASVATGQGLVRGADPASSGSRGQGRHRKS
jgi:putative flippase GtrA